MTISKIMEIKESKFEFIAENSGKTVVITVHRKYGAYVEHHHDYENGVDYDTNEFANDSEIEVEVQGVCKFTTKYLPSIKHPQIGMYFLCDDYGRNCIGVPDEIAKKIWAAESELLTDELSPFDLHTIQVVKKAIEEDRILPSAELDKKRKSFNALYNEGAEGFNPYDDYLAAEYVDTIKAKYPNDF